jgi:transposase-like protein
MVAEVRPNYEHEYAAMRAVAAKLGIGTAETVRKWVLCRTRHNTDYADLRVMPTRVGRVGGCAWW